MKTIISTKEAPEAIGPYSQAVMVGHQLFISGQIALDPATGKMVNADIASETRQIMKNVAAILKAADMDYSHIVQATVYLQDMNDFADMNATYAECFKNDPPSRATVEVSKLPRNARLEIAFVAIRTEPKQTP